MDGGGIRFITTHLETGSARAVQTLQMGELLAGPANTPLPVVIAGDFNAHAGTPAYELARTGGFTDAGPPGPTCCHTPPLDDPDGELRSRIDLILTRGLDVTAAATVGAFTAGRWPSDHDGVVATLRPRARAPMRSAG